MKLVKCPRCDLNYITEDEKFCKVCLREMKGESPRDELELCSICNEAPCLPGRDVCLRCLKEMNKSNMDDNDGDIIPEEPNLELESVSTMDEIIPDIEDSDPIPEGAENEVSLESVAEDEERNADNENEDDQ